MPQNLVLRLSLCSTALFALACIPPAELAECAEDVDCAGYRGGYCDTEAGECAVESSDHPNLESRPVASFSGVQTTFFRGNVCVPKGDVSQTGSSYSMNMIPALHRCITVDEVHPTRSFTGCQGGLCDTIVYYSMTVSGDDCPNDAFGKFDTSVGDTAYDGPRRSITINPVKVDGEFREALNSIEIPFLPNTDAQTINGLNDGDRNTAIKRLALSYAAEDDRVLSIEIQDAHPLAACGPFDPDQPAEGTPDDPDCSCYPVGFDDAFSTMPLAL